MYKLFCSGNLKETDKMDDLDIHGLPRMDLKGLRLGLDTGFLRLMFILDTFHRLPFV